jgi:hypothetical protein
MADDNATEPAIPSGDERVDDVFAARARVTREQAIQLIDRGGLDYGDRANWNVGPDGIGRLDLFVSRAQIDELEREGIQVDIESNQSARSRERQAEIGKGDRFEGGRVPPKGLGRKVGGQTEPGEERPR